MPNTKIKLPNQAGIPVPPTGLPVPPTAQTGDIQAFPAGAPAPASGIPMPAGLPVPPASAPTAGGGLPVVANVTDTKMVEDSIVAIGYIAAQSNYLKANVIHEREARRIYKKLYDEIVASGEKPADRMAIKPDGTEDPDKPVSLDEAYSVVKFRTFFPEEAEKMKAQNYCQVVLAEAKAKYLVIQALIPETTPYEERASILEQISVNSVYRDNNKFIITEEQAIKFIAASGIRTIKIYNDVDKVNEGPDGYVIVHERKIKSGKNEGKSVFSLKYIKNEKGDLMGTSFLVTHAKEAFEKYAVNQDLSENRGKVCDSLDKIINLEQFRKVFGDEADPLQYGTQVKYNKNNPKFSGATDPAAAAREAKALTFIEPGKPGWEKFEALGLNSEAVSMFRQFSNNTSGPTPVNVVDMLTQSWEASQAFKVKELDGKNW